MASSGLRAGLLQEILTMAVDTLRTNKMRSALTILGVVIGITSIVSMTALIRGFDESFKDLFRQIGPKTMFVTKFSFVSFSQGKEFRDLIKRPNITIEDARAIERSPLVESVAVQLGGGPGTRPERFTYGNNATKRMGVIGASANFGETNSIPLEAGRVFTSAEVDRRRNVVVLGNAPGKSLFPAADPIGKLIRIGRTQYTVVGVFGKRPNPLGGSQADEFAIIPHTTWQKVYGADALRIFGIVHRDVSIIVIPRDEVPQATAMREVEEIMRARHGLRLDQESDFDIGTQDALFKVWERISSGIFLALVVISSIALMVGGIGVMAIMTISVTERTREIGVRKALGARRREILWQFMLEAVFLTSLGGLIGIVLGASIGWLINILTGFPISLPWWSFAIGIGFSASVGIFFGIFPAFKAARLDPIEALRYE
ncbi:MAG: ABC transporter permease [Vicinamibacteraceae bacterium]